MANFLRHDPCTKCGSRDNRGIYDDGSEFCFGCHDYKRPSRVPDSKKERTVSDIRDHLIADIPEPNMSWLRGYLTDEQIKKHFKYSPYMKRHVYLEYENGDSDGKLLFWEARKVGNERYSPKVISNGNKPYIFHGKWKETNTLVIVEDIVSAIKLGDFVGTLCLHGSAFPYAYYSIIGNNPSIKKVIVWLDRDKFHVANEMATRLKSWAKDVSVVMTPFDPKQYHKDEITEILRNAI